MGFFDRESEQAQQYNDFVDFAPIREHKSKISHELISGAAAYEAAKAWEDHKKRNGEPDNHSKAKEMAAGIAGAFIDRMVETHGLDYVDRERAKKEAQSKIEVAIDSNGY